MLLTPKSGAYGLMALFALVAWSPGGAWAFTPSSPIDPTHRDCGEFAKQFTARLQNLHEQNVQCHKSSEPAFGTATGCSGSYRSLTAHIQCQFIEQQICQIQEARNREMETCNRRAEARAARERKKVEPTGKTVKRLADWGSRFKQSREIMSLVRDPKRYFATRLAGHAHVQRLIFRADGTLDKGRAQQLYLALHDFARSGVLTPNPLIRQIQRDAFRDIGIAHADTMRSVDKLIAEMKTINAELQGTPIRPRAPRPPPRVVQPQPRPAPRPPSVRYCGGTTGYNNCVCQNGKDWQCNCSGYFIRWHRYPDVPVCQ